MTKVKLTTVGNSVGVILPRETLERLKLEKGDALHLVQTPTGIELTPYDPEFEAEMDAVRRVIRKNRDGLRRLAK